MSMDRTGDLNILKPSRFNMGHTKGTAGILGNQNWCKPLAFLLEISACSSGAISACYTVIETRYSPFSSRLNTDEMTTTTSMLALSDQKTQRF